MLTIARAHDTEFYKHIKMGSEREPQLRAIITTLLFKYHHGAIVAPTCELAKAYRELICISQGSQTELSGGGEFKCFLALSRWEIVRVRKEEPL